MVRRACLKPSAQPVYVAVRTAMVGTLLTITIACQLRAPGRVRVAFLMPDSKTTRYETHDRPLFEAKLKELCPACEVIYGNADQDPARQQAQAQAAFTNGVRVLVIAAVDGVAAASIADEAKANRIPVIAYDRLIRGTDAIRYYISFDNYKVGCMQGRALLEAVAGKPHPQLVFINGSPTDPTASMNKAGTHSVVDGHARIAAEYDTPDWSADKAEQEMTQSLTALGNHVDGVRAANDGTAGGAIAALKSAGVSPLPPLTGQDAELAAIQRLLTGEQYMTVYKAVRKQAEAAAEVAAYLAQNKSVPAEITGGKYVENGRIRVPAVLLEPTVVTARNIQETILRDGFWTREQICTPAYRRACEAAGLR